MAEEHDTVPGADSEELVLEAERVLPAAREAVFAAVTDSEQLANWWGPDGFSIPAVDFQLRVGESYQIDMQPPEGDAFRLVVEFREVEPPQQLAFTFVWEPADDDDVVTLATLEFHDLGDSTEARLTQGRFKTEARRDLHRDGWGESFDRLERLLSAG